MGIEIELKYRATPEQQRSVLKACGGIPRTISMETTYYDTPDRQLSAQKITLRRRLENGVSVCTLKTPGEKDARGEWDCLCDSIEAAIPELCKLANRTDLLELLEAGVVPVCSARFIRQAADIETADFTAELALDNGVLLGGSRDIPLCEIELELKSGDPEAMREYMQLLSACYGLVPEKKSKFRRAMDLAEGV